MPVEELYDLTLDGLLSQIYRPMNDLGQPIKRVIIFDQFEEVFILNQEHRDQVPAFFENWRLHSEKTRV